MTSYLKQEVALKVAIIAGGKGTRMNEETKTKPKAMVSLGGRPVLWHMMKYFAHFDLSEFVIALGYKGEAINAYFSGEANGLGTGQKVDRLQSETEVKLESHLWSTQMIDTGPDTQNGGRLKRLADHLQGDTFFMAYCDSLIDVVPQ